MSQQPADLASTYLPRLREVLTDNVVDFWYPRCIDDTHGGYITSYDADGKFAGNEEKMIVTQSRMVWLFSRLARAGYDDAGDYITAAESGFEFLSEHMWDDEHGGFYWIVDRDGTTQKPNKHCYGQSFGLYGLSEYYRASGDERARKLAIEFFDLLEEQAYDEDHGGYVEYFEPDWTPITEGGTYLDNIEPDWSPKEEVDAELDPTTKLMNTHLHLMEAFTTFYRATEYDLARQRLSELLHVLTNTVVRKGLTCCSDKFAPDWTPLVEDEAYRIASYGHDIENVWLTMEAADALDIPRTFFLDLYEELYDYSLEYGYDEDHGGFYFYGPWNEPATSRVKAWWVQAEAIASALKMYRQTGGERYRDVFEETWAFIDEHHVDREVGEWHSGVTDDLEAVGRKGAMYKGAYHNGRALIECIEELEAMAGK
jgi:mannobiose 2-epimerase